MPDKMLYQQKLFSNRVYAAEAALLAELLKSMKIGPKSRILDIWSNMGDHSLALTKMGFKVIGIDISEMFVDYARKRVKAAKFHTYSNQIRFGFFSIADIKSAARKAGFESVQILKEKKFRAGSTCFVCRT